MIIRYVIEHPDGSGTIEVERESDFDPREIHPEDLEDEVLGYVEDDLFQNISIKSFSYE